MKNKTPLHVKIRRKSREYLQRFLQLFISQKNITSKKINKDEIKSIIIIRPNYRIGNLLFLTPLINELGKIVPNAKIDVLVGMRLAGDVLQGMPNIDKVIDIPRKLLIEPIKFYKMIKNIRSKKYDLAINVVAGSVSSEIATLLINSKYKVSYFSDKTFIPLTHIVKCEGIYQHSGSQILEILKIFTDDLPKGEQELDVKLSKDEIEYGKKELEKLLKESNLPTNSKTIALFRNARFEKKIPNEWWESLIKEIKRLDNSIVIIDILSPDIPQKLNDECLEYSNKDLRKLGAFFRACGVYLSADTGPLHLACASKAKVIGLFDRTNPKTYGPIGKNDIVINYTNTNFEKISKIILNNLNAR